MLLTKMAAAAKKTHTPSPPLPRSGFYPIKAHMKNWNLFLSWCSKYLYFAQEGGGGEWRKTLSNVKSFCVSVVISVRSVTLCRFWNNTGYNRTECCTVLATLVLWLAEASKAHCCIYVIFSAPECAKCASYGISICTNLPVIFHPVTARISSRFDAMMWRLKQSRVRKQNVQNWIRCWMQSHKLGIELSRCALCTLTTFRSAITSIQIQNAMNNNP